MNLTNATLLTLVLESDFVSKLMLFILLSMSIICWSLTLYLLIMIKNKVGSIKHAQTKLQNINSLDELLLINNSLYNTYAGSILNKYIIDSKKFLSQSNGISKIENLQENLYQTFDTVMQQEESPIPILSTIAQAAPLIGLLGTIWGLIHSFVGIAQQSSADIAAVAPGIAEALITTLGGLLVAIPALIMFNYMQSQIRNLEQKLAYLTNNFFSVIKNLHINKLSVAQNVTNDNFVFVKPEVMLEKEI